MNEFNNFKILSIDGGGIRGVFPAQFLSEIESFLNEAGKEKCQIHEYFDLICGTSTGGIIAIALALGMSAEEISDLFLIHAKDIFGHKNPLLRRIYSPKHNNKVLTNLLKEKFSKYSENGDTRLGHAKTRLCIPVYDLLNGEPNILKTSHHKGLFIDFEIPAYQAAIATSAAPTYFKPYNISFKKANRKNIKYPLKVDGGIFANNPTLIGILEAINGLGKDISEIKVLSIGTGTRKFKQHQLNKYWGIRYWLTKSRLLELFFQAQSDNIERIITIMNKGIGYKDSDRFYYKRIQHYFHSDKDCVNMDETNYEILKSFKDYAFSYFKKEGQEIMQEFFENPVKSYKPLKNI